MVRRLTAVFCILWCVLLGRAAFVRLTGDMQSQKAAEVFAQLGFKQTEVRLELSGGLEGLFTESRAMERLSDTARILGFSPDATLSREEKSNGRIWILESECGSLSGGQVRHTWSARAEILEIRNDFLTDYYLRVSVTGEMDPGQVEDIRAKMEEVRKKERVKGLVCTGFSGVWDRILTAEEKKAVQEKLLKAVGAVQVESLTDGAIELLYAYRESLGDTVGIGDGQVNFNVMLRDNLRETRCFVGIPVVLSDDGM